MVASLKFYTDSGRGTEAIANLSDAKVIVYEDGNDNKYILDASSIAGLTKIDDIRLSNLKDVVFKYQLKGGTETTTTGLGNIISALFATQSVQNGKTILAEEVAKQPVVEAIFDATDGGNKISETKIGTTFARKTDLDNKADADGTNLDDAKVTAILEKLTDKVVKTSELSAKTAAKDVVDAITASSDFTNKVYIKAAPADEVYTKTAADTAFVKTDGSNISTQADKGKALAGAILAVQDGNKSFLVDNLGGFLSSSDKAKYDGRSDQTAKEFLVEKGLKPTPQEVATELMDTPKFTQAAVIKANVNDKGFQDAVRGVMSHPPLEIPDAADVPISADW
ncbi:hypothetical protein [Wolbachia endosymbiont (group A) of Colletes cunicularius]|uniref:hypothetical protein n=1 Tax=Wolbachia endosymbiont (group A) of Colletes cunicularius TaxID=3139321 RepID=UPI0035C8AD85